MQRRDMLKTLAAGTAAVGVSAAAPAGVALAAASADRAGNPLEKDGVKFWSETSLKRIFPNSEPGSAAALPLTSARNAQLSFQLAFRNLKDCSIRVRAAVDAPPEWKLQVRRVGYVPMHQVDTDVPTDEIDGVGHIPGMVPAPLYPEQTAHIGPESNGAFWVTLHVPAEATVGPHHLVAKLTIEDEFRFPQWMGVAPQTVELPITVDVRPLVLERRRDFPATHWISADSIWEYYKTEPFSERFWELADAYIGNLTAHNLNVVYSPIFNARHEILERPAQLLKVRPLGDDKFEFDFRDVHRWIQIAKKHNADHLEWTHFFTPAPTDVLPKNESVG